MDEVRVCRVCGYQRGFHVSFKFTKQGQRIILICPGCGQSYDLGWLTNDLNNVPEPGRKIE